MDLSIHIKQPHKLTRSLGFIDALCVIINNMIGSGVFASPGVTLQRCGSTGAAICIWALSGGVVIIASLCYAELGAMIPSSGGDYEFFAHAYGPYASFTFGWYYFWIAKPGFQAITAVVFGNYIVAVFLDLEDVESNKTMSKLCSVALIIFLAGLNCLGVKVSSGLIKTVMVFKGSLVLCVIGTAAVYLAENLMPGRENMSASHSFSGTDIGGIGSAMIACLWAYEGWADIVFLAEETIHFESRLPWLITLGTAAVSVVYLLINISFFSTLSEHDLEHVDSVIIAFGKEVSGKLLAGFFALGVAVCAASTASGSIMTGGRVFYAISRAGQFPDVLSILNSSSVPWVAILIQSLWAIVLILLPGSSYSTLLQYFGPASWMYYSFIGVVLLHLRLKEPDAVRPFKVPGYPFVPCSLIVVAVFIFINGIIVSPMYSLLAIGFILLSIPTWWFIEKRQHSLKVESFQPTSQLLTEALL